MSPWLTDAEVIDLTGYKRSSDQLRWLNANHVKAYVSALNKVRVPRDAILASPKVAKVTRTEPDFTKVRRAI